jgi:hypothetical protein
MRADGGQIAFLRLRLDRTWTRHGRDVVNRPDGGDRKRLYGEDRRRMRAVLEIKAVDHDCAGGPGRHQERNGVARAAQQHAPPPWAGRTPLDLVVVGHPSTALGRVTHFSSPLS